MKRLLALAFSFLIALASVAQAAITTTGNVEPGDPSAWDGSTRAYIGKTSDGNLIVDQGSEILSGGSYLGYLPGGIGTATISGSGSTWSSESRFTIGEEGTGKLSVINGGKVSSGRVFLGHEPGSTGIATVVGSDSTWQSESEFSIGYKGIGKLSITGGGKVIATGASLGWTSGSSGTLLVSGSGSTWQSEYGLGIGIEGSGELSITDGGTVNNRYCFLGDTTGSTGIATVSGSKSTWNNESELRIGHEGIGTLNINDGGVVNVSGQTYLGSPMGGTGIINFNSGTLNTNGLYLNDASKLMGNGTINTNGLVSDVDLIFDANSGLNRTITLNNSPNQNIALHLSQSVAGSLGVGYKSLANLIIKDGITVASNNGYLGYQVGSVGKGTISGNGSKWENDGFLNVGQYGNGQLDITSGAAVSSYFVDIGYETGSISTATVSGNGSTLTSIGWLHVGVYGKGELTVSDGAAVSCGSGTIAYQPGSTGVVTVSGNGSAWSNSGWLEIGNKGNGSLNIIDGGMVAVAGQTLLGGESGTGTIHFDSGTLTTGGLTAATSDLTGTGTIITNGLVSDVDLAFDATHPLGKTIKLNRLPGQDITIHYTQNIAGALGAGCKDEGSLTIKDGIGVTSTCGYLGYDVGSSGTAVISGRGSEWQCRSELVVGRRGGGELTIADEAMVQSEYTKLGIYEGSTGIVTVSGALWINEKSLSIGGHGDAELNIINGSDVYCNDSDIGNGDRVNVSGAGSGWYNYELQIVAKDEVSTLNISQGGSVYADILDIYTNSYRGGQSFINMSSGGKLNLRGKADESLDAFLALIDVFEETDVIRWWDASIHDWAPLTTATLGEDYTLEYQAEGLNNYTTLTVYAVPEPCVGMLLLTAFVFPAVLFGHRNWIGSFETRRRR